MKIDRETATLERCVIETSLQEEREEGARSVEDHVVPLLLDLPAAE
jgi:hypothetical protein